MNIIHINNREVYGNEIVAMQMQIASQEICIKAIDVLTYVRTQLNLIRRLFYKKNIIKNLVCISHVEN